MAVTFRGSAVTPLISVFQDTNTSVPVVAIVNSFRSRVKVDILRAVNQLDSFYAATGSTANRVMPLMRVSVGPADGVQGGIEVKERGVWDTSLSAHDPGVKLLYHPGAFAPDGLQLAVNWSDKPAVWNQFTSRQATHAEQFLSWDNLVCPALASSKDCALYPGQAMIIEQVAAIPTGGACWFQFAWEEDEIDEGYDIAGNVKAFEANVSQAKVLVITDKDRDLPDPEIDIIETDSNGNFNLKVASEVKASVFVQHRDLESLFTAPGRPYIQKPDEGEEEEPE
jgi:hypothetical protein